MEKPDKLNRAKERTVLCFNFEHAKMNWQRKLSPFKWKVHNVTTLSQAVNLLKGNTILVAIAILTASTQKQAISIIANLVSSFPQIKWIAYSLDDNLKNSAVSAKFSEYCIDYFHYPICIERLAHTLGHAYGMAQLQPQIKAKNIASYDTATLIGKSNELRQLNNHIKKIAKVDSSLLITGETGTGKDLCAQLIHQQSARANSPLININCGALPESLIHSELFGHEKGAFTGAIDKYIGHIERAHQGTLFLDEIGDLPLELQVNLLHFLENHTIERLGGAKPITVDCRIIAATHIDLETAVVEGRFRKDLFHRLNILRLRVPGLREHREDIEAIAISFLKPFQQANPKLKFSNSAIECMLSYEWPGNVRELKNRVERAVVMQDGNTISNKDLGHHFAKIKMPTKNLNQQREDIDTEILLDAITRNNHNISAAARDLKISRTTFYRLIKKCNIKL
ncbi:sigma 54-interacting transcriptional regulator [Thalassotalea fonticola]|uniref:Sigma 54-interacting transcriptional regulator n=1 Tax=Thalassotalea fonticola TaxID=3065649 RepID=A0ABZ0GTF7_9GAMM|nr:sigma 54-interacting transcriptional regulator [Colwelliaceae bacterium S1-1]